MKQEERHIQGLFMLFPPLAGFTSIRQGHRLRSFPTVAQCGYLPGALRGFPSS